MGTTEYFVFFNDIDNEHDMISIYKSESVTSRTSAGSFIVLIANEAHESWQDEKAQTNYG